VTVATDPAIDEYLRRLRSSARELPRSERDELLSSIEEHLAQGLAPGASHQDVLTLLERLGDPEQLVREAHGPQSAAPAARGRLEWAALVLLLGGAVVPFLGWFAGVTALWMSNTWSVRDKLIGTLVVPGGLLLPFLLFLPLFGETCQSVGVNGRTVSEHCSGGHAAGVQILLVALLAALVIAQIASVLHLARRSRPTAR
jgi:hypothetical protein